MPASSSSAEADQQRLVFQVGKRQYEIDAAPVLEIIRVPHITRVPHGPEALAGIINLRGKPVPVVSVARMLGASRRGEEGKLIVYDHGGPVGLLVQDVLRLSSDTAATPLKGLGDLLDAAFRMVRRAPAARAAGISSETKAEAGARLTTLLSFTVAGQLYGLPIRHVREVARTAEDIAVIPSTVAGVIGLIRMRDRVLPLLSLASLLGLETVAQEAGSHIIVIEHEGDLIGLSVDSLDLIRRLPDAAIDAVPAVLQRGSGEAQIEAIGRIAEAGLLIAILSPEKLFGHQAVVRALDQNTGAEAMSATPEREEAFEQFLIFQLGEEIYGLPIGSVDEVLRVPDDVTRVPGAPAFIMGLTNLRGKVVPLIDQSSRFDIEASARTTKARAIVVTLGNLQAGFVVDAVSEVKAIPSGALSAAPEFSSDRTEVFDRVAHIEADGRMILLIDPQELLTRAERDIVAAITDKKGVVTGS